METTIIDGEVFYTGFAGIHDPCMRITLNPDSQLTIKNCTFIPMNPIGRFIFTDHVQAIMIEPQ